MFIEVNRDPFGTKYCINVNNIVSISDANGHVCIHLLDDGYIFPDESYEDVLGALRAVGYTVLEVSPRGGGTLGGGSSG